MHLVDELKSHSSSSLSGNTPSSLQAEQSPIIIVFFFLRNISLQLDAQISTRRHPGLEVNLNCGRLVFLFFLLFSDVAFHVTNGCLPPTTGPGLPPLQRLLLLQATGNARGTCFIPSARRRYCGCSAVSRGSEEPERCFLRRNAAGISCHFRKATFILAYFNNAAFRESENARLDHFPDAKE